MDARNSNQLPPTTSIRLGVFMSTTHQWTKARGEEQVTNTTKDTNRKRIIFHHQSLRHQTSYALPHGSRVIFSLSSKSVSLHWNQKKVRSWMIIGLGGRTCKQSNNLHIIWIIFPIILPHTWIFTHTSQPVHGTS